MKKKTNIKNLKVSKTMKEVQKPKVERNFIGLQILFIGVNLAALLTAHCIKYVPEERERLKDNVFENNTVIISQEEQNDIYREIEKELGISIKDDNTNYLLLKAIYDNPYLSGKEKEIFYKFIEYFNDNPYINLEEVYERMLNIDSRFTLRKVLGAEKHTLAVYLEKYSDIIYFELFPDDETRAHEGIHAANGISKLPRWLSEGMTQLITNEYFKEYPFASKTAYQFEVAIVKLICEIVGTDTVLEAYTKDNIDLIYEALARIQGTKEDAKNVLEYLEQTYSINSDEPIYREELYQNLEFLLGYMSEEKILENKAAMHAYLMLSSVIVEDAKAFTEEYVVCKAYLSSSLKKAGYSEAILLTREEYEGDSYKK